MYKQFWIEKSTTEELAHDINSPYRLCTDQGNRYALSTNDAIRLQKSEGTEFSDKPREFHCPLCGQHITDGKPCGCGAR